MKLKKIVSSCVTVILITQLIGCASIVSKSDYPVSFGSSPSNAIITITNNSGVEIYKGKTPTQVTLKSGAGFFKGARYTVKFEKEGCEPRSMVLEKQLDGWYLGNIIFGGLIGILIVDPATGAMWKLPENLKASLVEKTTALVIGEESIQMALLENVPNNVKTKLIKFQ